MKDRFNFFMFVGMFFRSVVAALVLLMVFTMACEVSSPTAESNCGGCSKATTCSKSTVAKADNNPAGIVNKYGVLFTWEEIEKRKESSREKLKLIAEGKYTEVSCQNCQSEHYYITEDCINCGKCEEVCPYTACFENQSLGRYCIDDQCCGVESCREECPVECILPVGEEEAREKILEFEIELALNKMPNRCLDCESNYFWIMEECIDCGSCEEVCPEEAIWQDENGFWHINDKCTGCEDCIEACPAMAIVKKEDEQAMIKEDDTDFDGRDCPESTGCGECVGCGGCLIKEAA